MKLPEISVRNRVTTLMVFLAILVIGGFCLTQLPIDLMPEMELPAITVLTTYPGAAAEDVETKVTKILEDRISTTPEVKHIVSTSKEEVSVIRLIFEWGANLDARANDIRDRVGFARVVLPDDVEDPLILKLDIANFPIMFFGVRAEESYADLFKLIQDDVADPLKRLPGVGAVVIRGTTDRQVNIQFDRQRLASYGLTPQDIVRVVALENQTIPGGNVKQGLTDYLLRVPGEFRDVEPMKRIVLKSSNGSVVRLGDVATVEFGHREETQQVRVNGGKGLMFMVQKQSGANTVKVARSVRAALPAIQKRLPPDVKIDLMMDSSEDIERSLKDLTDSLWQGGALTVLVVLVLLRSVAGTFVIALTMPFSLILTFILAFFFGYTINMMTMFGMIIAIGMVVDNAIVILENIARHREEGEGPKEAAVYGSSEVGMAIAASTLTTLCIFFPIIFVKGVTRIIFMEFAAIVTIVLMGSLFSALTLTPMLSSTLMAREDPRRRLGIFFRLCEKGFSILQGWYDVALAWSLRHRLLIVLGAIAIFVGSLFLMPLIGSEFMPEEDRALLRGTLHMPVGTRVEETARVMDMMERIIVEETTEAEREMTYWRCGQSEEGVQSVFGEEGSHIGEFGVKLVPVTRRKRSVKEIAQAVRRRIDAVVGTEGITKYRLDTADWMAGLILGGGMPLSVEILGDDPEATDSLAAQVRALATEVPGVVDVSISRVKGKPEFQIEVDRERASALGLNVYDIADTVRASFYGRIASKYRVAGDEYDIFVRLMEKDRSTFEDIALTPVRLPGGGLVQVGNLAKVTLQRGPLEIERKDQSRIVTVGGNVQKRSLGEAVADLEKKLAKLSVPQGVEIKIAGQTEEQRESFFWLTLALIIGILLVYMVMASQFESLLDPFVIMFSVPFAFTGVIWGIFLAGHNISIIVFIGLLLLVGTVVNNAIVLVDYTNLLRARGHELFAAVRLAGRTRLRPVLMTAITTIVALIPMAFGGGQGAEIWNPLGITVFAGLSVSTLITLIIVPILYTVFERRRHARAEEAA
ncbi:MAG TPA: efflux RND transporter permease subunit [Planctomycetota bacterium]|nr:efflux RND transporter permease subunit [Planctomycetota bacterium]